jgi:U2 small nuclear ribonucleoprotein B''
MFSRYGNILDIVSRRTYKLRGQAWVVFERAEDAAVAKEELEGFPFMNKPMVWHEIIYFRARILSSGEIESDDCCVLNLLQRIDFAKTKSDAAARLDGTYDEDAVEARKQERREAWEKKRTAEKAAEEQEAMETETAPAAALGNKKTLLVENIPKEANEGMLLLVFQRFPGLKEVKMDSGKAGVAYVEYDNEAGASAAVAGLQGFKLATDKPMKLTIMD